MKKELLITILACLFLSSCYKSDNSLPFMGYEYFPTDLGKWIDYDVDSVWQDDPIGPTGSGERHYQLHDLNESGFVDEEGRNAVRVERWWLINGQNDWSIKDVWFRVRTLRTAEQNEENVIFIKHNFPVRDGKSWDGNAENTLQTLQEIYHQNAIPEQWDYTYTNVNEPYSINGLQFDSTITVVQLDRPAAFGLNIFAKEVYAKHVGLIHKQLTIYDIQQNPNSPTDKDSVGFSFEMKVTDFGQ